VFKNLSLSTVLTIVGALVVGALGSGLWEILFKPTLNGLSSFLLSVATLGIQSVRDSLYLEAAKGQLDRAGIFASFLTTMFMCSSFALVSMFTLTWTGRTLHRATRDFNLVQAAKLLSEDSAIYRLRRLVRLFRIAFILLIGSIALITGTSWITLIRETYIMNTVAYLQQSQTIVGPFLTDRERATIASEVAQMKSRADFDVMVSRLSKIAEENKVKLSAFAPF